MPCLLRDFTLNVEYQTAPVLFPIALDIVEALLQILSLYLVCGQR